MKGLLKKLSAFTLSLCFVFPLFPAPLVSASVAQQASYDDADNIAKGTFGTCRWFVTSDSTFYLEPQDGVSGVMDSCPANGSKLPWERGDNPPLFTRAVVKPGVRAKKSLYGLFWAQSELVEADLSELDSSDVTDMGMLFCECSSLERVNLSGLDTSQVTDMNHMFSDCKMLTQVDVSSFDTSSVENMAAMFSGCTSLRNIDLSTFDTSNANTFIGMFGDCSSLESVNLLGLNTECIQNMSGMFRGCSKLETLDLSSFYTPWLKHYTFLFAGCSSLKELYLGDICSFSPDEFSALATGVYDGVEALEKVVIGSRSYFNYPKSKLENGYWWSLNEARWLEYLSKYESVGYNAGLADTFTAYANTDPKTTEKPALR